MTSIFSQLDVSSRATEGESGGTACMTKEADRCRPWESLRGVEVKRVRSEPKKRATPPSTHATEPRRTSVGLFVSVGMRAEANAAEAMRRAGGYHKCLPAM